MENKENKTFASLLADFQHKHVLLGVGVMLIVGLLGMFINAHFTRAAVSSYTFSGITNPSGTHSARTFEVDVDFTTNAASTIDTLTNDGTTTGTPQLRTGIAGFSETPADGGGGTVNYGELTTAGYAAITGSDDTRITSEDPSFGDTVAFWSEFIIAETPANITQIDIALEGYQGGTPQAGRKGWLGIWRPGAGTPYWETLEAVRQSTSDYSYSGIVSANIPEYIDTGGELRIIYYNEDQSDSVLIDDVQVDITFTAFVAPPAILTAVADDPDNGNRGLNTGDTLTLAFDKATNAPAVSNTAEVDGLLNFGAASLGLTYSGAWTTATFTNDTLTITVNSDHPLPPPVPPAALAIGDTVTIIADATNDLKDITAASTGSTSAKAVDGNWGLRPDDDITYASNSDANAKIYEVDLATAALDYVGVLPIPTFAISRRPSDGLIIGSENGAANGDLAFMNPDTGANGIIGAIGPDTLAGTVDEFYRLVYTTTGILYGMSNNNKFYQINDGAASLPAGTVAGQALKLCDPVTGAGLTTGGSADFAFHEDGTLYLISADDIFTLNIGACTATKLRASGATTVSGVAFTDGNKYHVSTFLPTNRKLHAIDDISNGSDTTSVVANFIPDVDIYDLASVPKWSDIEITKISIDAEFIQGTTETYTLSGITNNGPSIASGPIVMTDTLPTGLTYSSASGTGWACYANGQNVTCEHAGPISVSASLPDITLNVDVGASAAPSVSNTACIDSTTIDPDTTNNCSTQVNPAGLPDIATTKVDDDADNSVIPGQTVEYTLSLTNNGDITGTGINVDDTMDTDLENLSVTSITNCGGSVTNTSTANPAVLDINLISIPITQTCTIVFTADVKAGAPGGSSIPNTATVSATVEGSPGSTPGSDVLTVASNPNLSTSNKVDDDADNVVSLGQTVTYTLTIINSGNTTATGVTVDDTMDSNLENLSVSSLTGCGGVYTDLSTANPAVLDINGVQITTAANCVIVFTSDVKAGTAAGTNIPNTATVSAPIEGGPGSSPSSDILTVAGAPSLTTSTKVDDDADNIVTAGQTVTYTLSIINTGNITGTGIDITDTMDSDLENLSVSSFVGCGSNAGFVDNSTANPPVLDVLNVDILAAATCIITFTANVDATASGGASIPNTATVSPADEGGTGGSPSSDILTVQGLPLLDTSIKADDDADNIVFENQTVTYTLTLINSGNTTGTGINITDTMDTDLENLTITNLSNCGGVYTDLSTMNPAVVDIRDVQVQVGTNCVVTFTSRVKNGTAGGSSIPNTATVSAAVEGGTGSTPSSDILTVNGPPVLGTSTKTDDDADNIVDPLQTVTYTLTIKNTGGATGTGINVDDTMDTDLENLSVSSLTNCGTYTDNSTANPAVINVDGVDVAVGVDCVIVFTARVKTGTPGGSLIPNIATVSAAIEGGGGSTPSSDILTVSIPVLGTSTKVDDDADNIVLPNQTVTYTLTLINTGTVNGTGIDVTDTMDTDMENLSVTSLTSCGASYTDNSVANPAELNILNVDVAVGVNCVIVFTSRVKAATAPASTIPNAATVSAADEGGTGSNPSSDVLTVQGPPALGTSTKVDDDADNIVDSLQIVTYTLTLINTGGIAGSGIDVVDVMDTDLENLSVASLTNCGSSYTDNSVANPAQLNILDVDVAVGVNCVIVFTSRVKAATPGGTTIPNTATVSAADEGGTGSSPSSDILTLALPVLTTSTKVDDDADNIVSQGQVVSYDITLINTGTGTATGVDLADTLDADLENLNIILLTDCGGTYVDTSVANPPQLDISSLTITTAKNCVLTFTAQVKVNAPDAATIPNTATYSASNEGSPGGAVNSDVLVVYVPPSSTCGNGIVEAGEQCDDGNTSNTDSCTNSCTPPYVPPGCTGNCNSRPSPNPKPKGCFEYNPDRVLQFGDLDFENDATDYIVTLKNTRIIDEGDYVFSGNDNQSTGKQEGKFAKGVWDYNPDRPTTRLEVVKTILVSNCIPVPNEIPIVNGGFRFKDIPVDVDPSNKLMHFTARVFYTAYNKKVIVPNKHGFARPFQDANLAEILAIALRTTKSLTKEYLKIETPWYGKYMRYSMDHGILEGVSNSPDATIKRDDFAKMILRIMAHNPRSKVYKYVEQFDFFEHKHGKKGKPFNVPTIFVPEELGDELLNEPLGSTEEASKSAAASNLRSSASEPSCLAHEPNRMLKFTDVPDDHWAHNFTEILRTSKIAKSGDFIASGQGNPSVGKQSKYQTGEWEFRPDYPVNFFELIKVALVANCIPIEEKIVAPENGFEFRMLPLSTRPTDEQKYFAARVMYTGYNHGIIRGDIDPFSLINRFETFVILARAAELDIPESISESLPFPDTDDSAWYAPYVEYFYNKGIIKGSSDGELKGHHDLNRAEMAKILTLYIKTHPDNSIKDYGKTISDFYDIK